MAISEAKRAKGHKLLRNHDPVLNQENYNSSVMLATNYFNTNYDAKERMSWIKARFPKVKFKETSDLEFRALSNLIRLSDNGNQLSEKHEAMILTEVSRLTDKTKHIQVDTKSLVATLNKPSIQDKMDEKVSDFLGEFAGLVDQYTIDKTIPKVESLVSSMGIRGPMVKKVLARVQNTIAELQETIAGTDKQLVEGYSNFKKSELKKLLGIYESLVSALGQAKVMTVRKARKVKVKPPIVVAKSVKYQKENKDLKLKSIEPATVVGASEVWLFNTKLRKLQCYEASVGLTLTFKGTTLMNWDVEKSTMKTIRKPETLQALTGKRMYSKFFKETRAAEIACRGRFNDDCIILVAFK